jgi:hypothetical protein
MVTAELGFGLRRCNAESGMMFRHDEGDERCSGLWIGSPVRCRSGESVGKPLPKLLPNKSRPGTIPSDSRDVFRL